MKNSSVFYTIRRKRSKKQMRKKCGNGCWSQMILFQMNQCIGKTVPYLKQLLTVDTLGFQPVLCYNHIEALNLLQSGPKPHACFWEGLIIYHKLKISLQNFLWALVSIPKSQKKSFQNSLKNVGAQTMTMVSLQFGLINRWAKGAFKKTQMAHTWIESSSLFFFALPY